MPKPKVNVEPRRKGTNVVTGCVRLAYQSLLEAKVSAVGDDQTPKFTAVLLIEPNDPTLALLKKAAEEAAQAFFGEKLKLIGHSLRSPFRKGDEKAAEYAFYKGMIYINTNRKQSQGKPGVIDQARRDITDPERIYSGAWVRAEVNAYAYDQKGNKGVAFGLNNIQLLGDDERFGGRKPARDVFDAVVSEDMPGEEVASATDGDNTDALFG